MKNWKMIFHILFEHLILRLADNRGEGLPIDLGKFYRDEDGVLYYENSEKILKITSRYVEKLKDTAPTLKQRITELINSELLR